MKVTWSARASADFKQAIAFLTQESPSGAERVRQAAMQTSELLSQYPKACREGALSGTREKAVTATPYRLIYRVRQDELEIIRFFHGARRWP